MQIERPLIVRREVIIMKRSMEPLLGFAAFEKPNYPKSSVFVLMKFAFKEVLSASIFEVSFDFMMCSSLVALVYAFFACVVAFISILREGILGIFNQQGVLHMLLYLLKIIMLAYLDSSLAYIQVMDNGLYSGQPSILSFFLVAKCQVDMIHNVQLPCQTVVASV